MAYDDELARRLRELLDDDPHLAAHDVTEKKMFGGLAFLVGGHMAVAASGQGGLLVRVEPAATEDLLATTAAFPMEMRGRAMNGWLRVDDADVASDDQLAVWVGRGTSYAATLPPK